jgi:hypothetical protein
VVVDSRHARLNFLDITKLEEQLVFCIHSRIRIERARTATDRPCTLAVSRKIQRDRGQTY